jgi:hypothetical protein
VRDHHGKAKRGDLKYSISQPGPSNPQDLRDQVPGQRHDHQNAVETAPRCAAGLICQLDATDEKNTLKKRPRNGVARQKLEKAKADLTRQEELFKNKFVASSTLEEYRLKLAVAKRIT